MLASVVSVSVDQPFSLIGLDVLDDYVVRIFVSLLYVFFFDIVGAFIRVISQPKYLALGPLAAFGLGFSFAADLDLCFYWHVQAPPPIHSETIFIFFLYRRRLY